MSQPEQTLRATERLLTAVLEALPIGVWIMDASGRIVHGNPAGVAIWCGARYVAPEQFGEYKGWWLSTGKPIEADEWAAARAIRHGETSVGEEIEIECFDGTRKVILNSAVPLWDDGRIAGAIIVNVDITARKQVEAELRLLARTDSLTGAVNRRHFFDFAAQELTVAKRYARPLAVVLFDIDGLKQINDTRGHQAGDELLRGIAQAGRKYLRDADVLARYGGDEFVLLLPHTNAIAAMTVAERIRNDVAARVHATISCGVAEYRPPDDTLDALIHRADVALYEAKQNGRNRTVLSRT